MTSKADSAVSTRGVPRKINERAIFQAALEAFSGSGFNGASMREIANRAGTSLSNLYNYVPSKSKLLAVVLEQANADLREQLDAAVAATRDADAATRLSAVVETYVRWSVAERVAGVVAMSEVRYLTGALREEVVDMRDATQRIFTTIVRDGVKSGEFATPHPQEAARNIVLLCAALATWYSPRGGRSAKQLAAEQARLALAMVEARLD